MEKFSIPKQLPASSYRRSFFKKLGILMGGYWGGSSSASAGTGSIGFEDQIVFGRPYQSTSALSAGKLGQSSCRWLDSLLRRDTHQIDDADTRTAGISS